jgi:predicted lipoprotein with Yx(FWY)xxD motif
MEQVFRIRAFGAFAGLLCAAACGGADDPSTLKLRTDARLGDHLVDHDGVSLYSFGQDLPGSAEKPAISNCTGSCLALWPPFHADTVLVQMGISAADVGEISRADGTKQTTFRGWPLYRYSGDGRAGDVNGEGIDDVWFVLRDQAYSYLLLSNAPVMRPEPYLTDATGRSLYLFSLDTKGTATSDPVSACTSAGCIAIWPIFHSDQSIVPSTLAASDFTVFTRPDGQQQTAYKGHPLYFFASDAAAGDTKGRGVNNRNTLDPRTVP